MAKRKASRRTEKPRKPAATGPRTTADSPHHVSPPPHSATAPAWRDVVLAILLLLALTATVLIWFYQRPATNPGLLLTGLVWAVALAGLLGRLQAHRAVCRLQAILTHKEIVSARLTPDITEEESGLGMRYISAWLVAVLGIAASAVLWQSDTIQRVLGNATTFAVGATVSVLLALAVAANVVNRLKTRRLTRDFRAALNSERLALDTLGGLNVMISACLPTGERTRFNQSFLEFVGKSAAQMQGRGWLEVIHPEDRQGALDVVARPATSARAREYDICVRNRAGNFVWLHETLVPRFGAKGVLIEFIATAIDITKRVETEVALDKQIGDLKIDLAKAQAGLTETSNELAETKAELAKTKVSRNRFETTLNEMRDEAKNVRDALATAEANIVGTQAEATECIKQVQAESKDRVKAIETEAESRVSKLEAEAESRTSKLLDALDSARQEHQQAAAENKQLQRAFEKLQEEMGQLRLQDGDMREQLARHVKETREAAADAADARKNEAQYRARVDWLNQRCDDLGMQLAARHLALTTAQQQAEQATTAAGVELERRLREASAEALATQLRRQLDAVQRMLTELMATALDGPVKDAAHNTAAAVRAMADLVAEALKGAGRAGGGDGSAGEGGRSSPPAIRSAAASSTSFDLKRTALGVRDLLEVESAAKGVKLEIETAANLRAVYGDEIEIRAALMSLTDAALRIVEDGTLTLRLSEDANTAAHSTIRCELAHPSARVKTDAIEAALAIKSTDTDMPDAVKQPVAYQAAKAWRTMRRLQGQHGFQLPDAGGFSIWFTFTLERPMISASQRSAAGTTAALPAPVPGAAASAGGDGPAPPESGASRQMPRVPTEYLTCNLGEVVELGTDSMRILCVKPPKGTEVTIALQNVEMDEDLRAEVTWSKKIAGRKHDVGLKLRGLTQAEQQRLLRVAMLHRKVTTIGQEQG